MRFFEDKRGNYYPVADIKRIWESRGSLGDDDYRPAIVYLKGDSDGIEIYDYVQSELTNESTSVVKAEPGFEALTYWGNDLDDEDPDGGAIERQPVLAWKITLGDGILPVVLDEESVGRRMSWAILEPSGVVRVPGDSVYESIDAWAKEQAEYRRRDRERNATRSETARDQSPQSE